MIRTVKRAYRYRFHPTDAQAVELARTFGCVRKVYNLALAARTQAWTLRQERVNYNTTSAMLTAWKKTDDLAFLKRGLLGAVAAGSAAPASSVHEPLRQTGPLPEVQEQEALAPLG
jgi:transposase